MPFDQDMLLYTGWYLLFFGFSLLTPVLFIVLFFLKDRAKSIVLNIALVVGSVYFALCCSFNLLKIPKSLQNTGVQFSRAHKADLATLGLFGSYCFERMGSPWKELGALEGAGSYDNEIKRLRNYLRKAVDENPDDANLVGRLVIVEGSLKEDPSSVFTEYEVHGGAKTDRMRLLKLLYTGDPLPSDLSALLVDPSEKFHFPNGWYLDEVLRQIHAKLHDTIWTSIEQKTQASFEQWRRIYITVETIHWICFAAAVSLLVAFRKRLWIWEEAEPSKFGFRDIYAVFLSFIVFSSVAAFGAGLVIGIASTFDHSLMKYASQLGEGFGFFFGFGAVIVSAYALICLPNQMSIRDLFVGGRTDPLPVKFPLLLLLGFIFASGSQAISSMSTTLVMNLLGYFAHNPSAFTPTLNPVQYEQLSAFTEKNMAAVISAFFYACCLAPIWEELVFRRLLFTWLRTRLSVPVAILVGSAVFAISHLDINNFAQYFANGCVLSALYARTRSLPLCICVHALWNTWALGNGILLLGKW